MRSTRRMMLMVALLATAPRALVIDAAESDGEATQADAATAGLPEDYSCLFCHGESGTLAGVEENKHLVVTEEDLLADIHWQKGLRCHDCHGGNPALDQFKDHRKDTEFWEVKTPAGIPGFCGRCHSDTMYMRRYNPSPRTDQVMEYWTSGHGQRLKRAEEEYQKNLEEHDPSEEPPAMKNPGVATCIRCHTAQGTRKHTILAVGDPKSPVYPTNVATTCASCHSDAEHMAGRTYFGRPIGHGQYELWKQSVHGQAMLKNDDLSAPTCNDCHGNHGALPPEVGSVVNVCGTCHTKVGKLFGETRMKHRFEELELPGCATCHNNHDILSPTDEMLGMAEGTACARCHQDNKFGATLAGAETARSMRAGLENLKQQIAEAETKVAAAERLGMEVRGPRYDMRKAHDALTNARAQIHTFAPGPVEEALAEGLDVTSQVRSSAEAALAEHTYRRIWLACSLVPILIVVVLLLLYIRSLPETTSPSSTVASR